MDASHRDFVAATDVEAKPAKPTRGRDSLFLTARVQLDGEADAREVRIRNLSAGGLMAELGRVVPIAATVTMEVRGIGPVTGRVAWCAEGRVGIAFDAPIDPKRARKPVGTGRKTPFYAKAVS